MRASVEVVTAMTLKTPVFSGNHGNDWTIWEMKMSAHLMEKGLNAGLDPDFKTKAYPIKIVLDHST